MYKFKSVRKIAHCGGFLCLFNPKTFKYVNIMKFSGQIFVYLKSNSNVGPPKGTHRNYNAAMLQIPSFSPKSLKIQVFYRFSTKNLLKINQIVISRAPTLLCNPTSKLQSQYPATDIYSAKKYKICKHISFFMPKYLYN